MWPQQALNWASLGGIVGRTFSHTPNNLLLFTCYVGVVRWPAAGDTAGISLRRLSSIQHRIYTSVVPTKDARCHLQLITGIYLLVVHRAQVKIAAFSLPTQSELLINGLSRDDQWYLHTHTHTHTHAHTYPFNGPFSGTTRVSQYQKGKNQSGFYWSKRQWVALYK